MVCHETYKNNENQWISPDEVFTNDGKKFFKKGTKFRSKSWSIR